MAEAGEWQNVVAPTCFVAMPLSTRPQEVDRYHSEEHWAEVFEYLIDPAIQRAGYAVLAPERTGSEHITDQIVRDICSADMMLCDLSAVNPNVFFELGLRTSLNLPVALIHDELSLCLSTYTRSTHTTTSGTDHHSTSA